MDELKVQQMRGDLLQHASFESRLLERSHQTFTISKVDGRPCLRCSHSYLLNKGCADAHNSDHQNNRAQVSSIKGEKLAVLAFYQEGFALGMEVLYTATICQCLSSRKRRLRALQC